MKYKRKDLNAPVNFEDVYMVRSGRNREEAISTIYSALKHVIVKNINSDSTIFTYPTSTNSFEATLAYVPNQKENQRSKTSIADYVKALPGKTAKEKLGNMQGSFNGDWNKLTERSAQKILDALVKEPSSQDIKTLEDFFKDCGRTY